MYTFVTRSTNLWKTHYGRHNNMIEIVIIIIIINCNRTTFRIWYTAVDVARGVDYGQLPYLSDPV